MPPRSRLAPAALALLAASIACQAVSPATPAAPASQPTPTRAPRTGSGPALDAFVVDLSQPFFDQVSLQTWTPAPYAGPPIPLPVDLDAVANPEIISGLTEAQRAFLSQNGFVVIRNQEPQFNDIRYNTALVQGQPYFRTTDEAFHVLHLLFDDLLKALERQALRQQMINILTAMRDQVRSYASDAAGTSIQADVAEAEAYLEVAIRLFDESRAEGRAPSETVAAQLQQIYDAAGRDHSALFPDFEDDYGAYKPVGHYVGDPDLEAYFRGMTWLGRVHFPLGKADDPDFVPTRLPVILTLALRQAQANGRPASDSWGEIHRVLDFLVGPTDDLGPLEYAALMDRVYGPGATLADLADDGLWDAFRASTGDLPAPQIHSTFLNFSSEMEIEKGWRFMGQRFTMDAHIFQNLIFDKVEPLPNGTRREFPTGLDITAVFGSQAALDELDRRGDTAFPMYTENLQALRQAAETQPESEWLGRAYSAWLYSFLPVVEPKAEAFPPFMRGEAWAFKDVNAVLGSWAELKHDTILYSKMPEGLGGGGPPTSEPAPSYVEPNPPAFYRMAYIARSIGQGMEWRLNPEILSSEPFDSASPPAWQLLSSMTSLADQLDELGDAAARQLSGQDLGDLRYAITGCLGFHECTYTVTPYNVPFGEMPEVPIVAAVSGAADSVLEAATGYVDRIYVVVPLEGRLEIAQGGVFAYYEFTQPRSDRLTDDEWRARLDSGGAPDRPSWAGRFSLEGGASTDSLFFRVGDTYLVTEAGDRLNLRATPSSTAAILGVLLKESYLTFVDGPVVSGGRRWWKVDCEWCSFDGANPQQQGWIVEDPEWLERSY